MERAVAAAWAGSTGRPDFSDEFERRLAQELQLPSVADALSTEVAAAYVELEDLPPVTGFHVVDVPGTRAPCDLWLCWEHGDAVTKIPANVKTENGASNKKNRGCALGPLMSWLTEEDGRIDKASQGIDPDRMLVELAAGTRKLVPGRDYLLMIARDDGSTRRLTIRSLIARHRSSGTGLAVARHQNRDVTVYLGDVGPVIGPTYPIARELAVALLPAGGTSRLQAELLALVPERNRRKAAALLAAMTPEQIIERLIATAEE
jgi:hypothetical protein